MSTNDARDHDVWDLEDDETKVLAKLAEEQEFVPEILEEDLDAGTVTIKVSINQAGVLAALVSLIVWLAKARRTNPPGSEVIMPDDILGVLTKVPQQGRLALQWLAFKLVQLVMAYHDQEDAL